MATAKIEKVIVQPEISKKAYVLTLSEREARELILILGGVTGDIGNSVYDALDVHFKNRVMSDAVWKYTDIGVAGLSWAEGGDDGE